MKRRRLLVSVLGVHCLAVFVGCQRPPTRVRMATTTSVDNSGLLGAILPTFEQDSRIKVEVLAVGSGRAMTLLKRGEVDVGLTHDPTAEAAALAGSVITGYRKIMFNDFIVVGPPDDSADIAHASNVVDAFARIAASGVAFASRGDNSGTYAREQELWTLAKRRPAAAHLLDTGQGMGGTLRVASERSAYTLTDRATFEQFRSSLRLSLLCEGGTELLNTYAIFVRAGLQGDERAHAEALASWFADGDGRQRVAEFVARGQHVFHVWPLGTPRTSPADLPAVELAHVR
jgi:tungstate transport system substrate-binding protein